MTEYVAFLRGINIGGRRVLMDDLQKVFTDMGFTNVTTLIASGNVIFESSENDEYNLKKMIEEKLHHRFGFLIQIILRSKEEMQELIDKEPFIHVRQDKGTRLHITLFSETLQNSTSITKDGFSISVIGKRELASVVSPDGKTTDMMICIDKNFGKESTTRNWNTLLKLYKLL